MIPDPKWHLRISLLKSLLRFGAGFYLLLGNLVMAGLLVILAEVLGVVEEDVVIGEESCIENCIREGLLAAGSPEGSGKLGRVTGVTGVDEQILEQERRGTCFCSILYQSIVS